jgi:thiamine biosynthesis lipoprotein
MTLSWNSSDADAGPQHGFSHQAMACTWDIIIPGSDFEYFEQAARAAFSEVDRLERELSRFIDHSDIARINAAPAGLPVRIGPDAFECLELAARVHAETGGVFDVTVGGLVSRRGQPADVQSSSPLGMHLLAIDSPSRTVTKSADGLVLDLGAIGKGYAVDRAVESLRDWQIPAALVHSGQSSLFALAAPPGRDGWRIAVRNPSDHAAILGHVSLRDTALSGSGTLLHGPHIIDPHTSRPAASPAGAWATAPTAALSDAISTAFMILCEPEIAAYCRAHPDVAGLVCSAGGSGVSLSMFGEMRLSRSG